jgi:anti-sigma regulatory factor (Ser/Thr protein kinase)
VEPPGAPTGRRLAVATEFDPEPTAPRAARTLVRDVLDLWDCRDDDQVAAVLTSEVVTNAIRHTAGRVAVMISLAAGVVRVEAHDGVPGALRAQPLDVTAEDGRGLFLVQQLADAWGAVDTDNGSGKVVWFELPARPRE